MNNNLSSLPFIKIISITRKKGPEVEAELQKGTATLVYTFRNEFSNQMYKYEKQFTGLLVINDETIKQKIQSKQIVNGTLDSKVIEKIKALQTKKNTETPFGRVEVKNKVLKFGKSAKTVKNDFTGLTFDNDFLEFVNTDRLISNSGKFLTFKIKDNKLYLHFYFASDTTKKTYDVEVASL
ncbi:hypothetical protein [Mycoplasma struthionis]|uniref:Uncharacterized protein n=1 Tax=Mycoplasma struthionis TaxID=538220 RepID=A0A502MIU0_9MOLU|nr:hypothetical protein [Mycoplasma struthionis]TPI01934.1 hypothetical protein FJM01_01590 [Mycoplasma struthionis]